MSPRLYILTSFSVQPTDLDESREHFSRAEHGYIEMFSGVTTFNGEHIEPQVDVV